MQFLNPGYLFLALLGVIPVLLYFFRRKSRTVPVSTLVFFKSLAKEHQESAWLRRMKKLLSLLLTLAILFGVVTALARIVLSPKADELSSVVVLLDRSASMAAVDDKGRSRLDEAKEEIRARLAGLRETVGVSLVAYDARAEIALPQTLKRRQFLSELNLIETRPVGDNLDSAMSVAKLIAEIDRPSEIWHYTDRTFGDVDPEGDVEETPPPGNEAEAVPGDGGENLPEQVALRQFSLALKDGRNVGITAFQIRKVPLVHSGYEAYVQISASQSMSEGLEAEMEVKLGDVPVQIRSLSLEPGDREGIILPIEGVAGQLLRIRVRVDDDCFEADDEVVAALPEVRPVVAAWISAESDPFTELALSSIVREGELELWKGGPESWPVDENVDMVIFDGWLPETWPENLPAIVINPPGSCGPVKAVPLAGGLPHDFIRVSNEQHPLLFRVSTSRIALTQTAVIDSSGSMEPLWFAGNEPILIAGEVRGQRLVVMGFSPEQSERLPLMASYPLLIGNAVFWCAEPKLESTRMQANNAGDLVEIGDAAVMEWKELRNGKIVESSVALKGSLVELDRIGLWSAGEERGGSALLLSRGETDLGGARPAEMEDDLNSGENGGGAVMRFLRGEMTWILLCTVLAFLVVESYLFHRHAVY